MEKLKSRTLIKQESTLLPSVGILTLSHSENAALGTGHGDGRMSGCRAQALNLLSPGYLTFKMGTTVAPLEYFIAWESSLFSHYWQLPWPSLAEHLSF